MPSAPCLGFHRYVTPLRVPSSCSRPPTCSYRLINRVTHATRDPVFPFQRLQTGLTTTTTTTLNTRHGRQAPSTSAALQTARCKIARLRRGTSLQVPIEKPREYPTPLAAIAVG